MTYIESMIHRKVICEKGKMQPLKCLFFPLFFISVDTEADFSSMWFYNF